MSQQNYSLRQISMALLYSALSLEYYMDEMYDVYEAVRKISCNWRESYFQLLNWSLEESFELGLSA